MEWRAALDPTWPSSGADMISSWPGLVAAIKGRRSRPASDLAIVGQPRRAADAFRDELTEAPTQPSLSACHTVPDRK